MYKKHKKDGENTLYSMLNDIKTDFSDYPETPLTRDEHWKYRENLLESLGKASSKKKQRIRRLAAAGCAACIAIISILLCLQPEDDILRGSGDTNVFSLCSLLGVSS